VIVFEVAFPFLGVTITVTLHDPVLRPLSDEPDTLQNFAELATTFSETFEVESIFKLAKAAIDFAVADLDVVTAGLVTIEDGVMVIAVVVGTDGATVLAVVVGTDGATVLAVLVGTDGATVLAVLVGEDFEKSKIIRDPRNPVGTPASNPVLAPSKPTQFESSVQSIVFRSLSPVVPLSA
jgi:hypothetical protein